MVWASLSDVRALEHVSIAAGDLVAVSIPPSPAWLELVTETWAAGAAVLPVDHRLPPAEAGALLASGLADPANTVLVWSADDLTGRLPFLVDGPGSAPAEAGTRISPAGPARVRKR